MLEVADDIWSRSLQLASAPSSAGAARAFVAEALDGTVNPSDVDCLLLLTSEIVTNAVLHAQTPVELVVSRVAGGYIRVESTDGAETPPLLLPEQSESDTGRGMQIVAALAASWGVITRSAGKTVWFLYHPRQMEGI